MFSISSKNILARQGRILFNVISTLYTPSLLQALGVISKPQAGFKRLAWGTEAMRSISTFYVCLYSPQLVWKGKKDKAQQWKMMKRLQRKNNFKSLKVRLNGAIVKDHAGRVVLSAAILLINLHGTTTAFTEGFFLLLQQWILWWRNGANNSQRLWEKNECHTKTCRTMACNTYVFSLGFVGALEKHWLLMHSILQKLLLATITANMPANI